MLGWATSEEERNALYCAVVPAFAGKTMRGLMNHSLETRHYALNRWGLGSIFVAETSGRRPPRERC